MPSKGEKSYYALDNTEDEDVSVDSTKLLGEKVQESLNPIHLKASMEKEKTEEDTGADLGAQIQQQRTPGISRGMLWVYLGVFVFWLAVNAWLWSLIDWERSWEVDRFTQVDPVVS
jgi:hypothetical protein